MSVHCTCLSLLLAQLWVLGAARFAETSRGNEFRRGEYQFAQEAGGWFKVHNTPAEWENARLECYHEGAVLVSPSSADLATALMKLLTQADLEATEFFSGVSSPLKNGVFASIEGVALDQLYGQWELGQPNNWGGNQHCITFIHYKHSNMLNINDENCHNKFPFICYRPASTSNKLPVYGAVVTETSRGNELCSDYTFSQEAAGWLKLHSEPVNWPSARLQCYHEGAVLASPLNANLSKAMTTLVTEAKLNSYVFFSGVSSALGNGVFTSIEGVALDQLYTQWREGEPNAGRYKQCITYYHNNMDGDMTYISHVSCFEKFPYICYRPASATDKLTECGTVDEVSETSASGSNEFRSDYTFSQKAAGWLKLHRLALDWQTARLQCYHEGAVLASPLNANLVTELTKLLTEANYENSSEFFSGVSSAHGYGVFTSIEGVALDQLYTEWEVGQPESAVNRKSAGNQHCIAYFYYKDRGILPINYENCNNKFPYICFRPASASDKLTECGTVDKEYKLDARTGHCYKFHRHGMVWSSAARVCQAEGGHLAVIDSQPEADLLAELFAAHPPETLLYIASVGQHSASIGYSMRSGTWWTITGKRLEESGYYNWNAGEPNNLGGNQHCGGIWRNGRFDDIYCDKPYAFICEKTPDSLKATGNLNNNVF